MQCVPMFNWESHWPHCKEVMHVNGRIQPCTFFSLRSLETWHREAEMWDILQCMYLVLAMDFMKSLAVRALLPMLNLAICLLSYFVGATGSEPYRRLYRSLPLTAIPRRNPAISDSQGCGVLTNIVDPFHPWPALGPSPHRSPVQGFVDPPLLRRPHHVSAHCSLLGLITLVIRGWPVRFRISLAIWVRKKKFGWIFFGLRILRSVKICENFPVPTLISR